jgi:single-stranded-DNA-specific exonuclease
LILEQALEEIAAQGFERQAAIVVGRKGWNPGVVGIVAGRLADQLGRPVIVVGFDEQSGRGSVRGPAGSRLYDALSQASDVLVRFGGHQQAAGMEVREERLPEFRERFVEAVSRQPALPPPDAEAGVLQLEPGDELLAVLADLDRLEPCGFGNPRPRLRARGQVLEAREVKNGHLKLILDLGERRPLGCFAVRQGGAAGELRGRRVDVVGDLRHNTFPGAAPVELFVEQVLLCDPEQVTGSGTNSSVAEALHS